MNRKARPYVAFSIYSTIAIVAWVLVPGSFGRGVVVGLFGGIVAVLATVIVVGKVVRKRLKRKLEPPPLPTQSWDYAIEISDLDGNPVSFSDSSGSVLILNFWATWCAPCIAEFPSMKRLIEATADLDVRFGFITTEDSATVRKFIEKRGFDLPFYLLSGEPPECFKARAIPATFVLDKTGMIAMRHFGSAAWDAESVIAFVRGLAAKPA